MWRRIRADGTDWEVRAISRGHEGVTDRGGRGDILEFRPADGLRSVRRLAVPAGALMRMDDERLRIAFRESRPIGGDYYGRPGKPMNDIAA